MKNAPVIAPLGFLIALTVSAEAAPSAVQLANLTCGTNVSWFTGEKLKFDEAKAVKDRASLSKTGIRHLRLYLPPGAMATRELPDIPSPYALDELTKGIAFAAKEGLAVIISPFKRGTVAKPDSPETEDMVKLWGHLATYLADTNPNTVFFEIAGEPTFQNHADWEGVQLRCFNAMRKGAPRHLIIATANFQYDWSYFDSVRTLMAIKPLPDPDVIYNFHYRTPLLFTYQGSSSLPFTAKLPRLPYPSSPEGVTSQAASLADDATLANMVRRYGSENWNRARMLSDLRPLAAWAKLNNIHLTCNEFGVYRGTAAPTDRITYLEDVRKNFEELGIGWTVWSDNFGIFNQNHSGLDEPAARALGLLPE